MILFVCHPSSVNERAWPSVRQCAVNVVMYSVWWILFACVEVEAQPADSSPLKRKSPARAEDEDEEEEEGEVEVEVEADEVTMRVEEDREDVEVHEVVELAPAPAPVASPVKAVGDVLFKDWVCRACTLVNHCPVPSNTSKLTKLVCAACETPMPPVTRRK